MNRFAALLDRLAYEPGRNNKLRLLAAYFREVGDPDRGFALAALTGALSFKHAKPGLIRDLIAARTDPVLFGLSYDYVGDLSETVALMWPKAPSSATAGQPPPTLTEVVTTLRTLGKTELPAQLSRWLDELEFIAETEDLVPDGIEQLTLGDRGLRATVRCHTGRPHNVIKGATYHRLAFHHHPDGYRATVILDV